MLNSCVSERREWTQLCIVEPANFLWSSPVVVVSIIGHASVSIQEYNNNSTEDQWKQVSK